MTHPPDREAFKERQIASAWLETQRGKPQYRTAPHLSHQVGKLVRPLSKKYGSNVSDLAHNWADIIGAKFGRLSKPVKFTGSAKGRRLIISAPGPAATLMSASKTQLLDKLNSFLGPDYVKDLYFIQSRKKASQSDFKSVPKRGLSSKEREALQNGLERVVNPELKAALEKLGRHVSSKT